jgi:hypothetical protein
MLRRQAKYGHASRKEQFFNWNIDHNMVYYKEWAKQYKQHRALIEKIKAINKVKESAKIKNKLNS